ncbi:U2-type spliceosomal complex subunit CWC21 [Rhodotorula paludigena]|uniref:U2-type spliceosomal complex subunit CWC21 n=1 Tax=Rhodotorula paludigena TaxID=86838 RepID=UPI003173D710
MSYNNIGLSTPRGSGTSGHIQANRSHIRPRQQPRDAAPDFKQSFAHRAPDQGILDHERKRKVEAQCFELQVQLEDDGVPQDDIDAQVAALRERLSAQQAAAAPGQGAAIKPHERHQLAAAKQAEDERMRRALGIRADYVEGLAFDREAQAQLKLQRQEERERAREERAKIEAGLRADREKALRERDEQRRRHEHDMDRERRRQHDELEQSRRDHAARMRDLDGGAPIPGPADGAKGPSSYRDFDRSGPGASGSASRLPYDSRGRSPSRSRSPPPARARSPPRRYDDDDDRSRSRSRSPPPRASRRGRSPSRSRSRSPYSRSPSRSRSPPRRRARRDSYSPSPSRSRSPPRRRADSRSASPPRRRGARDNSRSVSPPPERRSASPVRRRRGSSAGSEGRDGGGDRGGWQTRH